MVKNEKLELSILFLISLLLSIYLFFQTYVISLDGAFQYIPIARDFASGLFRKALSHNQQPVYSLIIALVSRWVSDFELAGKLVSSFFGILVIIPIYFLGKRIFGERVALLSSFLLVIHPYVRRFSADVLKESTYLFFLVAAIWFAWRTIQDEKKYSFLFIPIFSVLAYLVRPDGIEVLLVAFFYLLLVKEFSISGRKRTAILLVTLSSCILLLPYLFYLRELRGEWTFGKAKSIVEMLGLRGLKDGTPFTQKILFSLKILSLDIFTIFHPLYIFLLIIGLFKKFFFRVKEGEGFLLSFCCLHLVILFLMVLNTTEWGGDGTIKAVHLSGRHVLPLLLISIYWVAEGFLAIHHWVYKNLELNALLLRLGAQRKSTLIMVSLFILILAIILPKTLKPQRYERLPEKWTGIWIRNQSGRGVTIFTNMPRVAYYAYANENSKYIDLRKSTVNEVKASMIKQQASYLVIGDQDVSGYPEEVRSLQKDFVEVIRFEQKRMVKIIVYKIIE